MLSWLFRQKAPPPPPRTPEEQEKLDFDFSMAVEKGDLAAAKALHAKGADVNAPCAGHFTSLHFAARDNNAEIIRFLLDAGATLNPLSENGHSPLGLAALNGCRDAVDILLAAGATARIDSKKMESDALVYTLLHGDRDIAAYLIDKGVDAVSLGVGGDYSPLHCAALRGYDDIVGTLLSRGAKIDLRAGWLKDTPLMWAVRDSKAETVALLTRSGADLEAEDSEGKTALGRAIDKSAGEQVLINLLKAGASPDHGHGKELPVSIRDYAESKSNKWLFNLLCHAEQYRAQGLAEERDRAAAESVKFHEGSAGNIRVASPLKLKRAPKAMI